MLTDIHIDLGKNSNKAMCRGISDPSTGPQTMEAGPQPLGQVTTDFPTQSLSDIPSAPEHHSTQHNSFRPSKPPANQHFLHLDIE
ncbi:hypothetical protein Nepgr_008028 [Nepenthes gracilis]|uniref:Uncharacterized protein n=1 Tax=Nepenthes gracilis TaxID=150966 RepID=A0AAD3S829_NEPGR|nr:hypothetical protein Nepgr_008028 [Nepenthes gracilis]